MKSIKGSGNVFTDLGFAPEEAKNLRFKSALVAAFRKIILQHGLNFSAAARLFGVKSSDVKNLAKGDIDAMTDDLLLSMLFNACSHVRPELSAKKHQRKSA